MLTGLWRMRGGTPDGVPSPAASRRRARLRGGGILAGLIVVTVAPAAVDVARHREPGGVATGVAALGTLFIAVLPQLMANSDWTAWRMPGARNHLLAARTMTGWRTVDLTRIRKVRLCTLPARYNTASGSHLVVIDADGSRIGVMTADQVAIRWIHDAVVASRSTDIRVSRWALSTLGIRRRADHRYRPCHDAHPVLATLATWFALIAVQGVTIGLLLR